MPRIDAASPFSADPQSASKDLYPTTPTPPGFNQIASKHPGGGQLRTHRKREKHFEAQKRIHPHTIDHPDYEGHEKEEECKQSVSVQGMESVRN